MRRLMVASLGITCLLLSIGCAPDPGPEPITGFIIVGDSGQIWWSETSGAGTWVFRSPDPGGADLYSVATGNDRIVAAGNLGQIWSSRADALTWEDAGLGIGPIDESCYGADRFMVLTTAGEVRMSSDGSAGSWADHGTVAVPIHDVVYGDGMFLAVGVSSNILWTEDLGGFWDNIFVGSILNIYGVTHANGRFVICTDNGEFWFADDGWVDVDDWQYAEFILGPDRYDITYGGGYYVAVGEDGFVWRSADATNGSWSWFDVTGGTHLRSIAYGNGVFVAVGDGGDVWVSADGSDGSWSEQSLGSGNLNDVAFKAE